MCCAYGSLANATTPCPICDVFKPVGRCPHVTGICRNRIHHPRMDVIFLKNAEVQCFNGCGYCKWAVANPKSTISLTQNPGWPGCCRPPVGPTECAMIQVADWQTISMVHHISIPPEIKTILDSVSPKLPPLSANSTGRSSGTVDQPQPTSTRNSGGASNRPSKQPGGAAPVTRSRQGSVLGPFPPTSNPPTSGSPPPADPAQPRRHSDGDKRAPGGTHSSQSSPSLKQKDLEATTPRRKLTPRGSISGPKSPTLEPHSLSGPRRLNTTPSNSPPGSKAGSSPSRSPNLGSSPRALPSRKPVEEVPSSASSSSGSSGSSDGIGSSTDSTLTSDGGFTDYLSSGSEEELQRQAEANAALVAQTQAEELEFKAARQQLQTVDLRPPKSWTSSLSGGPHTSGRPRPSNPYQSTAAFVAAPARG